MDPVWVIETVVFPRTAPRIIEAIEAIGLRWLPYDDAPPPLADGACAIFWGSLGAAYDQRVAARWTPGAIGDVARFACSAYHPPLHDVLANADAVFTTARSLVDDPQGVLAPLGTPARVFVRPDSALKPFSGRQLPTASLDLAALDHGFYYDDEHLPIVVSTLKSVTREWRFVVADGAVVAGCAYGTDRRARDGDVPTAATALATDVARRAWQAAPLSIVDVGEVDGALRVLELNPFSGADLYDCDARAVVTAASAIARRLA